MLSQSRHVQHENIVGHEDMHVRIVLHESIKHHLEQCIIRIQVVVQIVLVVKQVLLDQITVIYLVLSIEEAILNELL